MTATSSSSPHDGEQAATGPGEDHWSESDTTPERIGSALRTLLRDRHAANESCATARVLNLVVVVDRDWKGEIANRLARVGRYHASRTVLCAVEEGRTKLDAWATMSYDEPHSGLGVMVEQVEIDLGPEHLERLDTIIDPVVVSELSTLLWSPHGHTNAVNAVRHMIDVMLLDSDEVVDSSESLQRAAEVLDAAYVVDLAWLRTTPWRERLASSFDPPRRRAALQKICRITVRHKEGSTSAALLLVGWLVSRLGWKATPLKADGRRCLTGVACCEDRELTISLEAIDQDAPGLAGVTIAWGDDCSLSLDRAEGGLSARESQSGEERVWKVMGASRGEGGILGEGVRQALLRDPTYGPALEAARSLCRA
ncbi:MAG: glucose-6-phosphate dehydrogenase assembly protein OpcA [Solirubrobacteraceae bacterium]